MHAGADIRIDLKSDLVARRSRLYTLHLNLVHRAPVHADVKRLRGVAMERDDAWLAEHAAC